MPTNRLLSILQGNSTSPGWGATPMACSSPSLPRTSQLTYFRFILQETQEPGRLISGSSGDADRSRRRCGAPAFQDHIPHVAMRKNVMASAPSEPVMFCIVSIAERKQTGPGRTQPFCWLLLWSGRCRSASVVMAVPASGQPERQSPCSGEAAFEAWRMVWMPGIPSNSSLPGIFGLMANCRSMSSVRLPSRLWLSSSSSL